MLPFILFHTYKVQIQPFVRTVYVVHIFVVDLQANDFSGFHVVTFSNTDRIEPDTDQIKPDPEQSSPGEKQ